MKLAIISHTEHYRSEEGTIWGLGSTVNEINHLLQLFDTIYHVAMLHEGHVPNGMLPYDSDRIIFIPLRPLGGKRIKDKVDLIVSAPKVINTISQVLKEVDFFQFRAPTGIGVFVIPYLTFFSETKGWYKYAGNWNQLSPPIAYRLQRFMLKIQKRNVTINGAWHNQPEHCITFMNPCISEKDINRGQEHIKSQLWPVAKSFCFVGRIEDEKGIGLILKSLKLLSLESLERIKEIHVVGDGKQLDYYKECSKDFNVPIKFHGLLDREDVFKVYKSCQFLLLPSKSEGFPKVIAEAMNFGCIPIVSNVSSIGQYIKNGKHGFVIQPLEAESLAFLLNKALCLTDIDSHKLRDYHKEIIFKFTYNHYINQLKEFIIK